MILCSYFQAHMDLPLWLIDWLIDYLLFYVPFKNISLKWRRQLAYMVVCWYFQAWSIVWFCAHTFRLACIDCVLVFSGSYGLAYMVVCSYFQARLCITVCSFFQAHMKFPQDYPYNPPSVKFISKMWHPNVYEVRIFWQHDTIQHDKIQYDTVQYDMIQYGTIWYNTTRYGITRCCRHGDVNLHCCQALKYVWRTIRMWKLQICYLKWRQFLGI
jgi:hypothetical protein